MDGCLPKLVPVTLQDRLLHAEQDPPIARNPGKGRTYETMQKNFFWSHTANDHYQAVSNYTTCARSRERTKQERHLQLFYESEPLKFIAMDILCQLSQIKNGSVFMIVRQTETGRCPERNPR